MVKYVDNGFLLGWYFLFDGEYYGNGEEKVAYEMERLFLNCTDY